jgi:hypothetical protein
MAEGTTDKTNTISTDKLPENKSKSSPSTAKSTSSKTKSKPKTKSAPVKKYRALANHINVHRKLFVQKGDVYTEEQYKKLPERIQRSFEEFKVEIEVKEG